MRGAWASALFTVILAAPSAWAQTGTVAGAVVDKEHARPLPGATVRIDGTDRIVTTDSNGHFAFQDVPTGTHRLTWSHPTLDSLGLTMQSVAFDVPANDTVTVSLRKPSLRALLSVFCRTARKVLVVGRVTRLDDGVPVAGMLIRAFGDN